MVHYNELKKGKIYKLDDIVLGKFLRSEGDDLIFLNSEFGEQGENNVSKDEEDDYVEVLSKKLLKKYVGSGKTKRRKFRNKKRKTSRKPRFTKVTSR